MLAAEPGADEIVGLLAQAPWRVAVTCRDTWPHEYAAVKKDRQQELLAAFCEHIARGEGVEWTATMRTFGERNALTLTRF